MIYLNLTIIKRTADEMLLAAPLMQAALFWQNVIAVLFAPHLIIFCKRNEWYKAVRRDYGLSPGL